MGVAPESSGLTDCHAHLCDGSFVGDLGEVLARAGDAGVGAVVSIRRRRNRSLT